MITQKQKNVLNYIERYSKKKGYAPSLEEIRKKFNLASVSTAHYYIEKLLDKGYLKRDSHQPRGIEIQPAEYIKKVIPKNIEYFSVPVLGSANAGDATIFAEENMEGRVRISRRFINRKDGVFALRVEGDSMNKAEIDGKKIEESDFVLIDSEYRTPKNGDYVLSVIDGMANLKKYEKDTKTGNIKLVSESTNPSHKPIYISSEDDFMVNGKIIAVIKK